MPIHIGKRKIQRIVRFHPSCYYPLIAEDDWNINRLFGLSYGHPKGYSVSIGWRPSETKPEKIDLFAVVYHKGVKSAGYFYTGFANKPYGMRIRVNSDHTASFSVYSANTGEKLADFVCGYQLPFLKVGLVLSSRIESKIRKHSSFDIGKTYFPYK